MNRPKIAFGWQGTLYARSAEFAGEKPSSLAAIVYPINLRQGTLALLKQLHKEGWEIWIYTFEQLPISKVKLFFRVQGIPVQLITSSMHKAAYRAGKLPNISVKHPPAFEIDLIVDDKQDTAEAGLKRGFATHLIPPGATDWTGPILERCRALRAQS